MIERIRDKNGSVMAILITSHTPAPGIEFFTDKEDPLQVGCMEHPAGKKVEPHIHNMVMRTLTGTAETLFIQKGRVRISFYSDSAEALVRREAQGGDVVILLRGGHALEVLEDHTVMWETKQGPFVGALDKTPIGSLIKPCSPEENW